MSASNFQSAEYVYTQAPEKVTTRVVEDMLQVFHPGLLKTSKKINKKPHPNQNKQPPQTYNKNPMKFT